MGARLFIFYQKFMDNTRVFVCQKYHCLLLYGYDKFAEKTKKY